LDVDLIFEDQSYTLGDTIEVKVGLNAIRDAKVRSGRVDLVYEVRWVAPDTEHRPMGRLTRHGPGGPIITSYALRAPTKKMVEHKHSYVIGSAGFLESTHIEANMNGIYNARIQIHKDDPPYAFIKGTSMIWSLVAVLDVVRAVDVKLAKTVKVMFDPAEG
jgi:hypothetical protein